MIVGDNAVARTQAVYRFERAVEAAANYLQSPLADIGQRAKPDGCCKYRALAALHSAVVSLARLSDPHRELPEDGGSQSSQRPAGLVNGRTWLVIDRDVSRGDSTRRAPLTTPSSALCA
jgi:hypothetical protein